MLGYAAVFAVLLGSVLTMVFGSLAVLFWQRHVIGRDRLLDGAHHERFVERLASAGSAGSRAQPRPRGNSERSSDARRQHRGADNRGAPW